MKFWQYLLIINMILIPTALISIPILMPVYETDFEDRWQEVYEKNMEIWVYSAYIIPPIFTNAMMILLWQVTFKDTLGDKKIE